MVVLLWLFLDTTGLGECSRGTGDEENEVQVPRQQKKLEGRNQNIERQERHTEEFLVQVNSQSIPWAKMVRRSVRGERITMTSHLMRSAMWL